MEQQWYPLPSAGGGSPSKGSLVYQIGKSGALTGQVPWHDLSWGVAAPLPLPFKQVSKA